MSRSELLSPLAMELTQLIGKRTAMALLRAAGGRTVYVPSKPSSRTRLATMIGPTATAKLQGRWGGQNIMLPTLAAIDRAKRDAEIRQQAAEGMSRPDISKLHSLSMRHICNILRR